MGVIFGGPSPEHDVSILTGLQAVRCLSDGGYRVHPLFWSKTGQWFEVDDRLEATDFAEGVPKGATALELVVGAGGGFQLEGRSRRARRVPVDVVLVCCHGGPGEDGSLQAALNLAGIRFSGPTVAGAALTMDKLAFGALVVNAGIAALPRLLLEKDTADVGFPPPYIVKPRYGGSSIGIEVVSDIKAAQLLIEANVYFGRGAVIEPFRSDLFDLQVAVRAWPELSTSAIERPLKSAPPDSPAGILSYRDKYSRGEGMLSAPRELPAEIGEDLAVTIRRCALQVARLTGSRGVARVDFLSNGTEVWVNEVNSIPGSLARYLWVAPAISFLEQLELLLDEASKDIPEAFLSVGADGSILHDASSIASKLA